MPSEEANQILAEWSANPNLQIYYVLTGKRAFETGEALFMGNLDSSRWTPAEKRDALFFLYLRKKRTSAVLGFKLVLGEGARLSSLGEEKSFEEGLATWSGEH